MKDKDYGFYELNADFLKSLANSKRLMMIAALRERERTVSEFSEILDLPIANVSQHLKALRDQDIVNFRKEGQKVYYDLKDKRLLDACNLIKSIIIGLYRQKGKLVKKEYRLFKKAAG